MKLYIYKHFQAFSLGFGIGRVNQYIPFDLSISLGFITLGCRVVKTPSIQELMNDEESKESL